MSEEPSVDRWSDDLLRRRDDARLIQDFLVGRIRELAEAKRPHSYVLNLDAGWGQGKSFFLTRLKDQLQDDGFTVALVNAWIDDYADDPLLSVLAAIEKSLPDNASPALKKSVRELVTVGAKLVTVAGKHLGKAAVRIGLGDEGAALVGQFGQEVAKAGADAAADVLEASSAELGKRLIKQFEEGRKTIDEFRAKLQKLLASNKLQNPLFVLIDELDRCRPLYAIAMLERVKHLFDVDGVAFIVATDTQQLRHSINAVYGAGFDGRGYLLRFFDRTYRFPTPNRDDFISHLFQLHGIDMEKMASPPDSKNHVGFFSGVAADYDLTLRETERAFDTLRSVVTIWDERIPLQMLYLLPLIFTHARNDMDSFDALSNLTGSADIFGFRGRPSYEIQFSFYDDFGRPKKPEVIPLTQLLIDFLDTSKRRLPEITRNDAHSSPHMWIASIFVDEFARKHGSSHTGSVGPPSIVRTYPKLVASVGQFTASKS